MYLLVNVTFASESKKAVEKNTLFVLYYKCAVQLQFSLLKELLDSKLQKIEEAFNNLLTINN